MATTKTREKWWKVYANDDEKNLFSGKDGRTGLARHKDFVWRSVEMLSKESGLTKVRCEEIIEKYMKRDIVIQNPKNPENFGYWENVDPKGGSQTTLSVAEADQQKRLDKASKDKKK